MKPDRDRHHILQGEWKASESSRFLRNTPSLIPEIQRDTHVELHRTLSRVALLDCFTMERVKNLFIPVGNTFADIDGLVEAIEHATQHPRTHVHDREVGEIAIMQLLEQKPLIRFGMMRSAA